MRSVYFFTLHKCASSLFGRRVLPAVQGLRHMNHAAGIFRAEADAAPTPVVFHDEGFIYGPIRLSAPKDGPVYHTLVGPAVERCLAGDCVVLIMVRDPRDILISEYYSFGSTHGLSRQPDIAAVQTQIRERIRGMTLDEYLLDRAPVAAENFAQLHRLAIASPQGDVLKYEDLVENFDGFTRQLTRWVDLAPETIADMHEQSRPRATEDPHSHKRSGKVRAYMEKLEPSTIRELDRHLGDALTAFGYR